MITHIVIFWMDKPYEKNRNQFLEAAKKLSQIPGVFEFRAGKACLSSRAVVDDSFAVGISMTFPDQAAADQYQTHPIHIEFVEKYVRPFAKRFVVYDWS